MSAFMTPLDLAVHRTFHEWPGGLPAAAAALGVREQVLRNKVLHTCDTNHLTLMEAMRGMLLSGDHQILRAMADELNVRVLGEAQEHGSIVAELMSAQAEHGDVARILADALQSGSLTPRKAADIVKEIDEDIAAKQRLAAAVRAAAESGGGALHG